MPGNLLIAQSGGPSMVINQSLVGVVLAARGNPDVGKIYGALHGIQGILDEQFVDLRKETVENLEAVAATPSSASPSRWVAVRKTNRNQPTTKTMGQVATRPAPLSFHA